MIEKCRTVLIIRAIKMYTRKKVNQKTHIQYTQYSQYFHNFLIAFTSPSNLYILQFNNINNMFTCAVTLRLCLVSKQWRKNTLSAEEGNIYNML